MSVPCVEVVSAVTGESIAVFEKEEFADASVKALKQRLAQHIGVPRFQLRLLQDNCPVDDGQTLAMQVVQLVKVEFLPPDMEQDDQAAPDLIELGISWSLQCFFLKWLRYRPCVRRWIRIWYETSCLMLEMIPIRLPLPAVSSACNPWKMAVNGLLEWIQKVYQHSAMWHVS